MSQCGTFRLCTGSYKRKLRNSVPEGASVGLVSGAAGASAIAGRGLSVSSS